MEFRFLVGPEVAEAEQQLPVEQRVQWPVDSLVMYCFEGEKVIGRMGVMSLKFIEGSWIRPGTELNLPQLLAQMEAMLKYIGETHAAALVYDEQPAIGRYIKRSGYTPFPVTMYTKELAKKEEAA